MRARSLPSYGLRWVLPPLSNSWMMIIIWLYIGLNRTPNIDCYWVGAVLKVYGLGSRVQGLGSGENMYMHIYTHFLIMNYTVSHGAPDSRIEPTYTSEAVSLRPAALKSAGG